MVDVAVGCGVVGHPDDDDNYCLCDVNIGEPCVMRYGAHEVRGAEKLIRATDAERAATDILETAERFGAPWTREKFADLYEALMDGWEAYAATRADSRWLRGEIGALLRQGHSMIDVPLLMGIEHERVMSLLSRSHAFYKDWGDMEWLKFEVLISDEPVRIAAVNRAMGYSPRTNQATWRNLIKFYGKTIGRTRRA